MPVDWVKAKEWLRQAAENGHPIAMNRLGVLMWEDGDFEGGNKWLEKAAELNVATAMCNLGRYYLVHRRPADYVKARQWFQRALDLGCPGAADCLSQLPPATATAGADTGSSREEERAAAAATISLLMEAADGGSVRAMADLGQRYAKGRDGVEKDPERAIELLKRAGRRGYPTAWVILAECWLRGDLRADGKSDMTKAFQCWQEGANLGDPVCQYNTGLLLMHGDGTERNVKVGLKWIRMAASHDMSEAKTYLEGFNEENADETERRFEELRQFEIRSPPPPGSTFPERVQRFMARMWGAVERKFDAAAEDLEGMQDEAVEATSADDPATDAPLAGDGDPGHDLVDAAKLGDFLAAHPNDETALRMQRCIDLSDEVFAAADQFLPCPDSSPTNPSSLPRAELVDRLLGLTRELVGLLEGRNMFPIPQREWWDDVLRSLAAERPADAWALGMYACFRGCENRSERLADIDDALRLERDIALVAFRAAICGCAEDPDTVHSGIDNASEVLDYYRPRLGTDPNAHGFVCDALYQRAVLSTMLLQDDGMVELVALDLAEYLQLAAPSERMRPSAHYLLAKCAVLRRDFTEAQREYNLGLEAESQTPDFWTEMARVPVSAKAMLSVLFSEPCGGALADVSRTRGLVSGAREAPGECAVCRRAVANLKMCGKCKAVKYCSVECQKKHWPEHKKSCGRREE